jgi:predicted amidohydrolase
MTSYRIALANLPFAATPDDAVVRAERAVAEAAAAGARIVCFPECYVPGYRLGPHKVPLVDQSFLSTALARVAEAARHARITVVLGTERFVEGELRITAAVIDDDGTIAGYQDKVQLDPSEDATYEPAAERAVFAAGALTFGIAIRHEGWRYPETVRWAARRGAQLVFHPHYHWREDGNLFEPREFAQSGNSFHEKAALCRAAENTIFFASVNYASAHSPTTSVVVGPDGTALAWQPYGAEGLLVADLDLSLATGLLAQRCRS